MSLPKTLEINGQRYIRAEPEEVASEVAAWFHEHQATFFNAIGEMSRDWEASYNFGEPQWLRMAERLDANGKAVLRSMAQFLDCKE